DGMTNARTIQAINGGTIRFSGNQSANVLSGGSWQAYGNSTIRLTATDPVVTNAASVLLSGTGAALLTGINKSALETTLTVNQGALRILGGRDYQCTSV